MVMAGLKCLFFVRKPSITKVYIKKERREAIKKN